MISSRGWYTRLGRVANPGAVLFAGSHYTKRDTVKGRGARRSIPARASAALELETAKALEWAMAKVCSCPEHIAAGGLPSRAVVIR